MQRYFEINENGHNIRCKIYFSDIHAIRSVVVFCHGFGGHKDNTAAEKFAERLLNKYKGIAMVTYNWPCHGDDVKKKLRLKDCDVYLQLVIEYVKKHLGAERIYCYATSFGGYLALKYLSEHGNPFEKIALRCPAIPMYDILTASIITPEDLEKIRKGKEASVGFDRKIAVDAEFLGELNACRIEGLDYLDYAEDILIIHGAADELVPLQTAEAFADNNLIDFVAVEGADHRFKDPKKMEQAIKLILDFYKL